MKAKNIFFKDNPFVLECVSSPGFQVEGWTLYEIWYIIGTAVML